MIPSLATRFGLLPAPYSASFGGVRIEPLPDYDERRAWLQKFSNADGFFYPPQVAKYENVREGVRAKRLPRTTRPARVFHLPASHAIEISSPINNTLPYADSNLLVQVLAFIFGTRLQFEEWRFDGRVPTKSVLNVSIRDAARTRFLEHFYLWWKEQTPESRIRVVNLFFAFNRAGSDEWDWDGFSHQYMVFDGLFALHADLLGIPRNSSHKGRFEILCSAYGIPFNLLTVQRIFAARNSLFHEATWAGAMMGHGTSDPYASQYSRNMARLNARILCAITGYRNSYTASVWWAMGAFLFD